MESVGHGTRESEQPFYCKFTTRKSDGDKIFIQAQTPEALESITQSVFDGVCTANAMQARSLTMSYGPVEPENVFLMQAAASYLDVFGVLPSWAPIE